MTDITNDGLPERTHFEVEGNPLCGVIAPEVDALTDDPDQVDCPNCKMLHGLRARLAARCGCAAEAIPVTTIHVCGPSRETCRCQCPDGPCEHVWDGPWAESEDGLLQTATCSRCGMWASDHDLWVAP